MAPKSSKTSWVVALALVVGVGLIGVIFLVMPAPDVSAPAPAAFDQSPTDPQPSAAIPSARPAGSAAPPAAALVAPSAAPADPPPWAAKAAGSDSDLFAEAMPDFMVDLHSRVLGKQWLNSAQQKQLYEYGKEHKDDARPQLLLAWDARNREWEGIAASMYAIAYKADPRSKDDPNMLKDLVQIAGNHAPDRVEGKEAVELLAKAYGPQALGTVESELAKANSAGQQQRASRLSALRDTLHAR